jgi:hypothetical protein
LKLRGIDGGRNGERLIGDTYVAKQRKEDDVKGIERVKGDAGLDRQTNYLPLIFIVERIH